MGYFSQKLTIKFGKKWVLGIAWRTLGKCFTKTSGHPVHETRLQAST
jgi:hypothetical protein